MKVYVSLTTIPSRATRILEANLQPLLAQDFPVERIVVTIPTVNLRGQACADVDVSFLARYPNVVCHRPDYDWGPVMKYVGCLDYIAEDDALVFVCDDDQQYAPDRITKLVQTWRSARDEKAVAGWLGRGSQSWFRALHHTAGFRGVLLPKRAIVDLRAWLATTALPRYAAMNDDVLVGIRLYKSGYRVIDRSGQDDEFARPVNQEDADALHTMYPYHAAKVWDILRCYWRFNQPFAATIVVGVAAALIALGVGLARLF